MIGVGDAPKPRIQCVEDALFPDRRRLGVLTGFGVVGTLGVAAVESHLHPAGQSAMGRFLARVAVAGTQVVVETYSDHVLNGIRLAVGADGVLSADDVVVHYFPGAADIITLRIDGSGAVSNWPSGFFDQTEQDLGELARAKHRE